MIKIRSFLFNFKKVNNSIIGIITVCTMLTGLATFGFKESNIEVVDLDEVFGITSELNSQLEAKADLAQEQANGIVAPGDLDAIGQSQLLLNTTRALEKVPFNDLVVLKSMDVEEFYKFDKYLKSLNDSQVDIFLKNLDLDENELNKIYRYLSSETADKLDQADRRN